VTQTVGALRLRELQESARAARVAAAATRCESREALQALHWHVRRLHRSLRRSDEVHRAAAWRRPLVWDGPTPDLDDVAVLVLVRTDEGA
jgi:hypothetical protein